MHPFDQDEPPQPLVKGTHDIGLAATPRRLATADRLARHRGTGRDRHPHTAVRHRPGDLGPRLRQHRLVRFGDHLHRRRCRDFALPRLPDRGTRGEGQLPASGVAAHLRRAPNTRAASRLQRQDPPPHHAARGLPRVLRRLPHRRPPHGRAVLSGQRTVHLLPGQPGPLRPRACRDVDRTAAGQDAHHRGLRLQEIRRSALPLPGQHPGLRRQLPAHDLWRPRRGLSGQPAGLESAQPAVPAACRPRAELLDLHGPPRRLQPRQPVRLGVRRRRGAVRPVARRAPTPLS